MHELFARDFDGDWNNPKLLTYRYCFDLFGDFLEMVQRHIDLRNVEPKDLFGLRYYLNLVAEAPYYETLPKEKKIINVEAKDVFRDFMRTYYPDGWHLVKNRHQLPAPRSSEQDDI